MKTFLLTTAISIAVCTHAASQSAGAAGPIGAYTVVPQLPGMGRPVDTAAVAARRRALLKRIGSGTVLIPAGHERNIEQDYVQDNDFRQDNTFYYFTELETQDAVLMMTARGPDSFETILFLAPRTPSQERWTGLRLGPDSTAVRSPGSRRCCRSIRSKPDSAAGPNRSTRRMSNAVRMWCVPTT